MNSGSALQRKASIDDSLIDPYLRAISEANNNLRGGSPPVRPEHIHPRLWKFLTDVRRRWLASASASPESSQQVSANYLLLGKLIRQQALSDEERQKLSQFQDNLYKGNSPEELTRLRTEERVYLVFQFSAALAKCPKKAV